MASKPGSAPEVALGQRAERLLRPPFESVGIGRARYSRRWQRNVPRREVASPLRARDPPPRHADRRACARSSRASRARSGIYACGPTVYGRIHVGNARPFVVFSLLKRFLEHEGYDVDARGQRHRRQRQDLRRRARAGRPLGRARARDDRALRRRHRRARPRAPRPRAAGHRDDRRDRRPDRGADRRAATPTRPTATSTSACARYDAYGELSHRDVDQMDQGEGVEGADRKEDPLDFALWKATKEGEDTAWDSPVGPRPPGLAHRVLGDGRGAARRGLRHPRRRHRPRLPPPRERGGADAGRARRAARALWMHNGMLAAGATRRWPSRSATSAGSHEVLDEVGARRAGHVLLRRPLPPADRLLRRARSRTRARACGADPRGRAAAGRRATSPAGPGAAARRVLRRAGRRLQHAAGAGGAATTGSARPTGARARSAAPTCARCSTCSGSTTCSTRRRRAARRGGRRWPSARDAARDGARLRRGRPPARRAARAGLGGPRRPGRAGARPGGLRAARRRAAGGREAAARRGPPRASARRGRARRAPARRRRRPPIVYGRNPVREALRGRRRVQRVWATAAAAKEGSRARSSTPTRSPRAAAPTPTRASAREVDPYPYADAAELLAAPDPLIVALDEVTDPQNLGAVVRTAECAGATGRRHPRAPLGRGHAGGRARRRPARSSTCRSRACATSPTSSPRPRRRAAGPTAPRPARARRYDAPGLHRRGRPGARRGGPRAAPAGRGAVRRARRRCRCAGGSTRSTSAPPAAVAAVRDLAANGLTAST